ncbi:unnamed protein product [Closterium sp. Yama58-4]|nr:unnamed protein product [Closterium sp. Yama58-4]
MATGKRGSGDPKPAAAAGGAAGTAGSGASGRAAAGSTTGGAKGGGGGGGGGGGFVQGGLDAIINSISLLGDTLGSALDPLASPPPQAPGHASSGPAATSAATSTATLAAALGVELAAEDDLLVRLPKGREILGGREEVVTRASEAAVRVPKETQLVASRNVATAMAMRAKQLQADLKAARRDAMDARERCRAVEEENERLRAALAAAEAAKAGGKGDGVGEREVEGGLEGEGGVDTHHHHHHSELEDMLHEQLGVLLQEKAELVAGKAAVERENEMLHHLLLYYEHLYLHRAAGTPGKQQVLSPDGGHVLPEGGEHVVLAGGQHVMSAEEHAALMHEHMHLHGGDLRNQQPGTEEAESGTTDIPPEGCAGEGENQEGQERAEEHTGPPLLSQEVAGEGRLDEAKRGSVVGDGAGAGGQGEAGGGTEVSGGGNGEEGQEKAEEHTGPTSLQPEVAGEGLLDEGSVVGEGAEAGGGTEVGGGERREEGHDDLPSLQQQVAVAASLDETREGREACGGAEAGGDGMVDGSSDGVRVNGAVSGVEEEQKGGAGTVCAGSGVDDCAGSKVYAGS